MAEFLFTSPQELASTTILGGNVDTDKFLFCNTELEIGVYLTAPLFGLLTTSSGVVAIPGIYTGEVTANFTMTIVSLGNNSGMLIGDSGGWFFRRRKHR